MTRSRIYVGVSANGRHVFRSTTTPTFASHGDQFYGVIGPFRTQRGAQFMATNGQNNPHCRDVRDAERIAKQS